MYLETLEPRVLLSIAYPTAYDQYLLELVNRARANPAGEAASFGIDLNEGLDPGTITTDAKPPLAMNLYLVDAAQGHSQWMVDTDTFSHTGSGGSNPDDRMETAGYTFTAPWGYGENIAMHRETPTVPEMTATTAQLHRNLFVDEDYAGRGHRLNIVNADFMEFGAGVIAGDWDGWNAVDCTEDFAYTAGNAFLTGVGYDDSLVTDDDFYTPGEGLSGLAVTAVRQSDGAEYTTTTWSSGGYNLQVPAGTYDVWAQGASLGSIVYYADVVIGTDNVKRDFTPDDSSEPDLTVPAVDAPTTADIGTTFDVDWTGQNNGTVPALGAWTDRVYLSTDAVITTADTQIGSLAHNGPLGPGDDYNATVSVTVATAGTYYIGVITDADGSVAETNETNNSGLDAIPIVVSDPSNQAPTISSLSDSPDPVTQGETVTLTANGVSDADGTVAKVEFYRDSNSSGSWEGSDTVLGTDTSSSGGWNWTGSTGSFPTGTNRYFARAQDDDGDWSIAVTVTGTVDPLSNQPPTISSLSDSPDPVTQGNDLTLTANNPDDSDGSVVKVEFYRDSNSSGSWEGSDTVLGTDTSSSGGWNWTGSTSGFPIGTNRYFARAQDDDGDWSSAVTVTGRVNQAPTITALTDAPDPLTRGNDLTLTATGVSDTDGTVAFVAFFRDANGNGTLERESDAYLGQDTDGGDGWAWTGDTLSWPLGAQTYFAQGQDDDGAWSNAAATTGQINAGTGGTAPTLDITGPALYLLYDVGQEHTIAFTAADPDSAATINLYYDTDLDPTNGNTLIVSGMPENAYEYDWDTSGVAAGLYYIYGYATDGENMGEDWFDGAIVLSEDGPDPIATFDTSLGTFTVELDQDAAPITVANFRTYADAGFFDGLIFHRVMSWFMCQGGGFYPNLTGPATNPAIFNENVGGTGNLSNQTGTISMARTSEIHSATSQFFINVVDNPGLDYVNDANPGYCVFGHVDSGMDVVNAIRDVPVHYENTSFQHLPDTPVVINSVVVATPDEVGPRIIAQTPTGTTGAPVGSVDVTFNELIDAGSFTVGDVTITAPGGGDIVPTGIINLDGQIFRITFANQIAAGKYDIEVGPNVTDEAGNEMDQNENGANGQAGDTYEGDFRIADDPPVAENATYDTPEDTGLGIVLAAADPNGDAITHWDIRNDPDHGVLTGGGQNWTYTPDDDYHGADAFTFRAKAGGDWSDNATITLDVTPVNDAPVAQAGSVYVVINTATNVTVTATDVDQDTLTYDVTQDPIHGDLTGTGPVYTYTPDPGYEGLDSFDFRAWDGTTWSGSATVSTEVGPAGKLIDLGTGGFKQVAWEKNKIKLNKGAGQVLLDGDNLVVTEKKGKATVTGTNITVVFIDISQSNATTQLIITGDPNIAEVTAAGAMKDVKGTKAHFDGPVTIDGRVEKFQAFDFDGTLNAQSVGSVKLKDTDIDADFNITGNMDKFSAPKSSLTGVYDIDGRVENFQAFDFDGTLNAQSVGSIKLKDVDIDADFNIAGSVDKFSAPKSVLTGVVRIQGTSGNFKVDGLDGALVSILNEAPKFSIGKTGADGAQVLVGYDIGADLLFGTGDESSAAGVLTKFDCRGPFEDTIIAVSVSPANPAAPDWFDPANVGTGGSADKITIKDPQTDGLGPNFGVAMDDLTGTIKLAKTKYTSADLPADLDELLLRMA